MTPNTPPRPQDASDAVGMPVEARERGGWTAACVRTLLRTVLQPSLGFGRCPEPIAHGKVLGFLATLRLPAWVLLVGLEIVRVAGDTTAMVAYRRNDVDDLNGRARAYLTRTGELSGR